MSWLFLLKRTKVKRPISTSTLMVFFLIFREKQILEWLHFITMLTILVKKTVIMIVAVVLALSRILQLSTTKDNKEIIINNLVNCKKDENEIIIY